MSKQEGIGLAPSGERPPRKRRSKLERRQIVEATIGTGISIAAVARAHGVNANQVHHWRRLYEKGLLGAAAPQTALVPVRIIDPSAAEAVAAAPRPSSRPLASGAIDIEAAKARIRVEGAPDAATLRLVLECLLG